MACLDAHLYEIEYTVYEITSFLLSLSSLFSATLVVNLYKIT
jgi:hypothetical protein